MPSDHSSIRPHRPVVVKLTPEVSTLASATTRPAESLLAVWLQVLSDCGYGIWLWLGSAMALSLYSDGRGEALVPLMVGGAFVSLGLLLAGLRLPGAADWHGWRWGQSRRPTGRALMALATYLPMLAVAALARGENNFWATRLACLILALCSLACLTLISYGHPDHARDARQTDAPADAKSALLPLGRVIAAGYSGGLWLWACVMAQAQAVSPAMGWMLGILSLALLLGLLEGIRWQTVARAEQQATRANGLRFIAAALSYALPCVLLLLASFVHDIWWLAMLAGVSAVIGRSLEQWLFGRALARLRID